MKIQHEAPAPDVDWKVNAALFIETPQGEIIRVDSWSLSAIEWPENAPECPKAGTLTVPFQGLDIRFPVRLDAQKSQSLVKLKGLSGRQRETLALFYRSLLSGRMASSGEVITSLDTPLDLVPMEETEAEKSISKEKSLPRLLRAIISVATYVLLAVAVVGVVGNNIYSNVDRIDIQHGRVLAPISQVFAPRGGLVERVDVVPGQNVSAGEVLLQLSNPVLKAKLKRARVELLAAENAQKRRIVALAELDQHRAAKADEQRKAVVSRLHFRFSGRKNFDDMWQRWTALQAAGHKDAAQFDPLDLTYRLITAQAEEIADEIAVLRATRDGHKQVSKADRVVALSDGVIRKINVRAGQILSSKDAAIEFEAATPRVTMGWVSERFAETIFIGMPATIGLNEKGKRIQMSGVVTDVRAGQHPERPGEFGIIVVVTVTNLSASHTKIRLRVGAPVNLEAKRQIVERLKDWIMRLV